MRSHALLVLISIIFGPAVQPLAAQAPPDLAARSKRGSELMAAGRYAEAAALYRELVKALPDHAGLALNLGMALHLSARDREALPHLQKAIRLDPGSIPANLFLGAAQMRLRRPAAAVAPLQKAVRLQPDNHEARSLLVDALLGLERYGEAEPHLRRLSQAKPSDAAVWFTLGKTYEELAARTLHHLVERQPESPYALALVAEARLQQQQRAAAFRLYRRALERGATIRGLHVAVADIYRRSGRDDWAAVEEAKEARLPRPDCVREELECAYVAGKYREVVAAAPPKTAIAAYWIARAYSELAGEAFGQLTALPPSAQSHEWRAEQHRLERRFAESAAEWRKAIGLAPADSRLKVELAIALRMSEDLEGAQTVLEEVVRAEPDAPDARNLLGDVLVARQHPERAIPLLKEALRLDPTQLAAHASLARAYVLLGDPAAAIPHFQKALPSDVDGSIHLQLARALQAAGRVEQARQTLRDYEEFRKAAQAEAEEATGPDAGLAPPDEPVGPPGASRPFPEETRANRPRWPTAVEGKDRAHGQERGRCPWRRRVRPRGRRRPSAVRRGLRPVPRTRPRPSYKDGREGRRPASSRP